jgi:hypothetical protein
MGHYRRGTAAPLGNSANGQPVGPPPGLTLTWDNAQGLLIWTWTSPDPFFWDIDRSLTGEVQDWETFDNVNGNVRAWAEEPGWFYRLRGFTFEGPPLTDYSNVVFAG